MIYLFRIANILEEEEAKYLAVILDPFVNERDGTYSIFILFFNLIFSSSLIQTS